MSLLENLNLDLPVFCGQLMTSLVKHCAIVNLLFSSCITILLFGPLRSHYSVPAHTSVEPSRAGAVRDERFFSAHRRLALDRPEHDGRLIGAGICICIIANGIFIRHR